jgi:hypothetical protein
LEHGRSLEHPLGVARVERLHRSQEQGEPRLVWLLRVTQSPRDDELDVGREASNRLSLLAPALYEQRLKHGRDRLELIHGVEPLIDQLLGDCAKLTVGANAADGVDDTLEEVRRQRFAYVIVTHGVGQSHFTGSDDGKATG